MSAAEWKRYQARAQKILRSKSASNLDREGKRTGECKYCPFTKTCGVAGGSSGNGRARANRGSKLEGLAKRIMQVKDEISELKAQEDELKEDLKQDLHKRKETHLRVGDIDVSLTQVKGRATLDKKAVAAAGIDLSPFEKVGAPSERLDIKRIS